MSETTMRPLLLSLRPRFANAILAGEKSVEVRRRRICVEPGTPVILYSSSPVMAVVGTALVQKVHVLTPRGGWRHHGRYTALTRGEYDSYLDGSELVCLIYLQEVRTLRHSLPLHELRHSHTFRPPQSYRFIKHDDPTKLRELASLAIA